MMGKPWITHDEGPNDMTVVLPRPAGVEGWETHTVDVGALYIGEPTHVTRDGHPMTVQYGWNKGYLVAVDTSSLSRNVKVSAPTS